MPNKFTPKTATGTPDPFNRAAPGFSLTQKPGQWDWEKPPKITHPAEAVDSIIDNLEKPDVQDDVLNMLIAGISVEEMVNVFAVHGVDRGQFNPDVAEIIKGPLAFYLLGLADEFNIPVKLLGNKEMYRQKKRGMTQSQLLNVMKRRNPELHETLTTMLPENVERAMAREQRVGDSFLREKMPPPEMMMMQEREMEEPEEPEEVKELEEMREPEEREDEE